jgi:tRNA U34 5-methylaminomethyl-2-thiouridine-forming methyltransferase MnmC
VDVNDVSHALEQVIDQRKAEDTWQVDSFGGVSAAPIRPPDEVWHHVFTNRNILCSDGIA